MAEKKKSGKKVSRELLRDPPHYAGGFFFQSKLQLFWSTRRLFAFISIFTALFSEGERGIKFLH
jgi:hypothetical protein